MGDTLLEVRDLHVSFYLTEGIVRAVSGVTLNLQAGRTLGVVGESGCGKSVTARAILNMVQRPGRIDRGEILWYGDPDHPVDIAQLDPRGPDIRNLRWGEIAMIFQEPMTSLSPVHSIGNQMIEAIRLHHNATDAEATEQSVELLNRVGLSQPARLLDAYRHELSGGMRQRVMIAMALTCSPRLLIADEPTTALDVTTQSQILDLMRDLQDEFGMAILFITHDLGVIAEMADDVAVMYLGKEVEIADVDTIFHRAAHPYTQALLRSIPRHDVVTERLESIVGNVPDPYNIPPGCAFHPRCHHYLADKCASPELVEVGPGQWALCARTREILPASGERTNA
ncbi:MAG: ABC transporter ATP-binding protein [Anaerolineaceae bacterium]|nr:ABC transporter ATP-binding protein [Anaerolineaceae bacterium]MCY4024084.1 ABC transporter ATP-binding protein [Anaerolineaceae bacterium]